MKKDTRNALLILIVLISAAYLPFLGFRVLRMAGDEKVYVSQAIEMAREGRWFVQTLADTPDYYKGPLHYILVRVGFLIFGYSLMAVTYMNWLFAVLGAIAFFFLGTKWRNKKTGTLLGLAFALNIGIFSHSFASQMEVELCGFYAIATALLGLSSFRKQNSEKFLPTYLRDLPFWLVAGLTGLSKSPLHSFLIGLGGLTFWLFEGTLLKRIKSPGAWLSALTGVFTCIAGYLPAYLLDQKNFLEIFIGRENVQKPNNGRGVDYVLGSYPHFLFPWTAFVLVGLVKSISTFYKKVFGQTYPQVDRSDLLIQKLGWGMALPTFLFFCSFPYKGQNYNLPAIGAVILIGFASFQGTIPLWSNKIAGALVALITLIFSYIFLHFFKSSGLPAWWHASLVILPILCLMLSAFCFWVSKTEKNILHGTVLLFAGFATAIIAPGEREMIGIKQFISANPQTKIIYYNLEPTIWSEWGLLQAVLGKEICGLHQESQLKEYLKPGYALIVPGDEALKKLSEHAKTQGVDLGPLQVTTWKRWLTKGKNSNGETLWVSSWKEKNIELLERNFYILWR